MANYEKLTNAGIDIPGLLNRIMGNTTLIRLFVSKFMQDTNYSKLQAALNDGNISEAEHASHTLKGMCGNMSLQELYLLFTKQTNLLRAGELDRARDMMDEISPAYGTAILNMRRWLEES